jgi:hypothetical protein
MVVDENRTEVSVATRVFPWERIWLRENRHSIAKQTRDLRKSAITLIVYKAYREDFRMTAFDLQPELLRMNVTIVDKICSEDFRTIVRDL